MQPIDLPITFATEQSLYPPYLQRVMAREETLRPTRGGGVLTRGATSGGGKNTVAAAGGGGGGEKAEKKKVRAIGHSLCQVLSDLTEMA